MSSPRQFRPFMETVQLFLSQSNDAKQTPLERNRLESDLMQHFIYRPKALITATDRTLLAKLVQEIESKQNPTTQELIIAGMIYDQGIGVTPDLLKAFKYVEQAATSKYPLAICLLGAMYYYGAAVTANSKIAISHYEQARTLGCAEASNFLGVMYEKRAKYESAKICFEEGMGRGSATAANNLASLYERVIGDYKAQIVSLYKEAIAGGSLSAMSGLGLCYLHGRGLEQNTKTGLDYLEKAYSLGSSAAGHNLAFLYSRGNHVPKDIKRAIALCKEVETKKVEAEHPLFYDLDPKQYTIEENIEIATYLHEHDENLKQAYPHLKAAILAGSKPALDSLTHIIIQRTGFEEKEIRPFCQRVGDFATFDDLERSIVDNVAKVALPPKMTLFSAQSPTDSKQSAAAMPHDHKKLKKD